MHLIDWCITLIPVAAILALALYSRRYVRGVVDFLAAGRVAGRYVISVGSLETALGVLTLVALVEAKYQTGYALAFWEYIVTPLGVIMSLTGYCVYRFRETKALSIGQFLEMRYNRSFRIFAATLRTVAEMLTNAIGPAVAANFFIYFLGLPHRISVLGIPIPCFAIVVALVLFYVDDGNLAGWPHFAADHRLLSGTDQLPDIRDHRRLYSGDILLGEGDFSSDARSRIG